MDAKKGLGLLLSTSFWLYSFVVKKPSQCKSSDKASAPPPSPSRAYYGCRPGALQQARAMMAKGDDEAQVALADLKREAEKLLKVNRLLTVTHKAQLPPSGDKHDYASYAPYWWPDPDSASGLPYVRRDGVMNPDARDDTISDSSRRIELEKTMRTACMAYYFTREEKYADYALQQARCWFLDEETRMNPHLVFAQARRGSGDCGNRCGVLEGRHIIQAADALALLVGAEGWREGERERIDEWLRQLLDWYLSSTQGIQEGLSTNNHGSFYDEQVARLALCLGRVELAQQVLESSKHLRIATQIAADGSMPEELKRTNSLSYTQLNLQALCALAVLGEHAGVDLWGFRTINGRGIEASIDFLVPYIDPAHSSHWPYPQLDTHAASRALTAVLPELRMAAAALHRPDYELLAKRLCSNSNRGAFDVFLAGCTGEVVV